MDNEAPKAKIWKIPVEVKVETETESEARLIIQNQLGNHEKVKSFLFDQGEEETVNMRWKPISSAPKDRQILGYEADIKLAYSARWSADRWHNLVTNDEDTRLTHWMEQPAWFRS